MTSIRSAHPAPSLAGAVLAAAAFLAAQPSQAALTAATGVCYRPGGVPQSCDSNQVTSEFGEAGTRIGEGADFAAAIQGYGFFHGSASVTFQNFTFPEGDGIVASAAGIMQDTWRITGGSGLANLHFGWTVTGSTASSGSGPGHATEAYMLTEVFSTSPSGFGSLLEGYASTGQITGSQQVAMTGSVPFYFGQPIYITFKSLVRASAGYGTDYHLESYSGAAMADFANTAVLTSVTATNAQGALIEGITIQATSGAQYPLTAVPEPGSWGLMLTGLLGLGAWRRTRA